MEVSDRERVTSNEVANEEKGGAERGSAEFTSI
jgi:hypothetical protein